MLLVTFKLCGGSTFPSLWCYYLSQLAVVVPVLVGGTNLLVVVVVVSALVGSVSTFPSWWCEYLS